MNVFGCHLLYQTVCDLRCCSNKTKLKTMKSEISNVSDPLPGLHTDEAWAFRLPESMTSSTGRPLPQCEHSYVKVFRTTPLEGGASTVTTSEDQLIPTALRVCGLAVDLRPWPKRGLETNSLIPLCIQGPVNIGWCLASITPQIGRNAKSWVSTVTRWVFRPTKAAICVC